ncbi:MAG TPA: ABC transporter permease [Candidatus Marinimicrobia bacterium]|nr:ABC transporter permease [Candidatus Neomarinimicrobiota bacterium]HRU91613.1 ABC transporter permease [Candidatus Neomarinimicrobiota bacterium]
MIFKKIMLKNELRLDFHKILLGLFFNIIGTGLVYFALVTGLGRILPRIDYLEVDKFLFSSIIGFTSGLLALGLASSYVTRYLQDSRGDYQRLAGMPVSQIYGNFLIRLWLILILHLLITTLTVLVLSGFFPGLGRLLLFWVFAVLPLGIFIQLGMVIGLLEDRRNQFYWIFLILVPLFLMSGMIVPTHLQPGFLGQLIAALPSTAFIEGGRFILLHQPFELLIILYLFVLNILLFIGGVFFFRRKLQK